MRPRRIVTIRGVRYGSCAEAAAALGVTRSAVSHAIRRGTLDGLGVPGFGRSVRVRGVVYPTQKAAADALGVTPATVYQAIRRGNADSVGTRRKRPVVLSGSPVVRSLFEAMGASRVTITDVAAAMGITPVAVSYWKSGRTSPPLLTAEAVADMLGYEIVLRKKAGW